MFKHLTFRNFKALRETDLPLSQVTLIVGPNSSGKSTALQSLIALREPATFTRANIVSVGAKGHPEVRAVWRQPEGFQTVIRWPDEKGTRIYEPATGDLSIAEARLNRIRVFSFEGAAIAKPVTLRPNMELLTSGGNLAGVLDRLRDSNPEQFKQLNIELHEWLPEFDHVLFDTPQEGVRGFLLRPTGANIGIRAGELSHGTLFALALLTLTYVPEAPSVVGIEEPERGIHPRLLRRVQDAVYRLGYSDAAREAPRSQVIVTTHSPFFLDLFSEHPEEIIIAEKRASGDAQFSRLSDRDDIDEILGQARLGDLWYSGVLGGVPSER